MGITREQLFRRVAAEVGAARSNRAKRLREDDFERVLPATLHEVALAAWVDRADRPYVVKTTPVAITFAASVATVAAADFLWECLMIPPLASIKMDDATYTEEALDLLRNAGDLFGVGADARSPGLLGYGVDGERIVARHWDGTTSVDGAAKIYGAGFVPTVTLAGDGTLHTRLEARLVAALVAKLGMRDAG